MGFGEAAVGDCCQPRRAALFVSSAMYGNAFKGADQQCGQSIDIKGEGDDEYVGAVYRFEQGRGALLGAQDTVYQLGFGGKAILIQFFKQVGSQ